MPICGKANHSLVLSPRVSGDGVWSTLISKDRWPGFLRASQSVCRRNRSTPVCGWPGSKRLFQYGFHRRSNIYCQSARGHHDVLRLHSRPRVHMRVQAGVLELGPRTRAAVQWAAFSWCRAFGGWRSRAFGRDKPATPQSHTKRRRELRRVAG